MKNISVTEQCKLSLLHFVFRCGCGVVAKCKGTGWEVVHDVGCYISDFPSSSGALNTKAVASVPTSTLLTCYRVVLSL